MFKFLKNLFARAPSPRIIEAREAVYARHFGVDPTIYHSTDWKFPHVDVYEFAPNGSRQFHVLVTGGMSEYRQPVADDAGPARVELVLQVGTVDQVAVTLLKLLAEYPSRFDTYFASYQTVPLGGSWGEGSEISAFLLAPVDNATSSGLAFERDGDAVDYLLAVPITRMEHAYAQEMDSKDLFRRLNEANLLVHADHRRRSVLEDCPDESA